MLESASLRDAVRNNHADRMRKSGNGHDHDHDHRHHHADTASSAGDLDVSSGMTMRGSFAGAH